MESLSICSIIRGSDTEHEVCPLHAAYKSHRGCRGRFYVASDLLWWGVIPYKLAITDASPYSRHQDFRASSRVVARGLALKNLAGRLGMSLAKIYNPT